MPNADIRVDPLAEPRPWGRAFVWLVVLGVFFFTTYGGALWITGQRSGVGFIVFGWEAKLPFWPWTIVPYWTIDAFYAVSLFVCATRRELDVHVRRLVTAQVICVAGFLLFPLRFSFDRPAADGFSGWLFAVLGGFDRPFNQAPSLHIALLVILWDRYAHHLRGAWRVLLHLWFALVGASVLTTWQHHFIDIPTGALVGFFALWLWPESGESPLARVAVTGDRRRRVIALRYAAGAVACAALAFTARGTALWLLWPAWALAMVALAYFAVGPALFQKRAGRLSPAVNAMLAPYLAGAWINSRVWPRRRPQPDPVADGVWLGRVPTAREQRERGIRAVVDLCCELPVATAGIHYAHIPVLDLIDPDDAALRLAATEIDRARARGPVLVCCALGYSRSAAAVAAWLVATGRERDAAAAIRRVRAARPAVVLSPACAELMDALAAPVRSTP